MQRLHFGPCATGHRYGLIAEHDSACRRSAIRRRPQGRGHASTPSTRARSFPARCATTGSTCRKQYDPAKPACVHVNQDGIQFNAPAVFDELIHKKEMPVDDRRLRHARRGQGAVATRRWTASTAATSTTAWATTTPASCWTNCCPKWRRRPPPTAGRSSSRTTATTAASAARSSGAVCAFTAAWERPDAFRRVFSAIGTYVGLRGGNVYPTLIRKFEPKPLRVFLQDGSDDLNIYGGDWWMANQEMERALRLRRLRSQPRLGRRRPQRQARHRSLPRRHALAVEGLAGRRSRPAPARRSCRNPRSRRRLETGRRGLQVHRRAGRQRQGRGVLQRRAAAARRTRSASTAR